MSSLSFYPPETNGGTLTSWIPVGTTFPSQSGCESLYWSVVVGTLAVWDPGYGISVDTNVKCLPPAATTWWNQDNLGVDSLTRVSLGPITCPSDYTTGTTMIQSQSSTFVACCPTNYTFVQIEGEGVTGECSSEVPAGMVITYAIRNVVESWYITSTSYTTATCAWGTPVNGYNIAPQTSFSSTISTSATSSTTSAFATRSAVVTPPATNTPQPSSGLSTGAKAGIGVGFALLALALGALIVFLFVQRKQKSVTNGREVASNLKSENTGPVVIQGRMNELEGRRMNELEGRGVPAEMDSAH